MLGNGEPVRDFSDVRDVVRAYALLAERGRARARPTTCAPDAASGSATWPRVSSRALAARLRVVTDADLVRPVDVPVLIGDPTKLVTATGWQPEHDLDDTLDAVLADARARG